MTITPRQAQVLTLIHALTEPRGPTMREVGEVIGVTSSCTVFRHVEALERKGLVTRQPGKARGLLVTEEGRKLLREESAA